MDRYTSEEIEKHHDQDVCDATKGDSLASEYGNINAEEFNCDNDTITPFQQIKLYKGTKENTINSFEEKELDKGTKEPYEIVVNLGNLKCDICHKIFVEETHFHQHLGRYRNDKLMACTICEKPFHKMSEVMSHSKAAHPEIWKGSRKSVPAKIKISYEPFEIPNDCDRNVCNICDNYVNSWLGMVVHKLKVHGSTSACKYCETEELYDNLTLLEHLKHCHFDKKGTFQQKPRPIPRSNEISGRAQRMVKCKFCSVKLPSKKMGKHLLSVHTGKKSHHCTLCGDGFKTAQQLSDHSKTHKDDEQSPAVDDDENTQGKSVNVATDSEHTVTEDNHSDGLYEVVSEASPDTGKDDVDSNAFGVTDAMRRVHRCEICGVKSSKSGLARHMKRHHHSQSKLLSCHHCKKTFVYQSDLELHLKRHYDEDGIFRQLRKRSNIVPV